MALLSLMSMGAERPLAADLIPPLSFSAKDTLDRSAFANRDLSRAFLFALPRPGTGAAGPALHFTADKGSRFDLSLSPRTPPTSLSVTGTAGSLAFTLDADRAEDAKDKIMLDVVPFDRPGALSVTDPHRERFIGFDILFDEGYQVSRFWTIHLQAWQCCGGHPPLTVNVRPSRHPDDPIQVDLSVINDDTEVRTYGHGMTIASFGAQRGRWMNLVLALQPRACADGTGRVAMWKDGVQLEDWHGCWGFSPAAQSAATRGKVTADIGLDLGVYRRREPLKQTVFFDNIRYGTTLADVTASPKP